METKESKKTLNKRGVKLGQLALMAALLSTSIFVSPSYANPEGGQVVGGSATFSENGTKLDIYQQTERTVIDWRSFDIDVDEHTQFYQPSSSAVALNRVNSADPSQILGKLSANGNIILVNPNGVFFGKDSVVDVNGLIATSADIDTDSFMAGSNHFNISGQADAAIINEGTITAKEAGLVGLVAPTVENHGVITAKMGRVQLSSGDTVVADFYGDGLLKVEVTDEALTSQFVNNTGTLEAEGGTVAMTAAAARQTVNSLVVAAGELKAPAVSTQGGKIIISAAGGTTKVSGTLIADGENGGGEILIGGDYQGQMIEDTSNTARTLITAEAHISANATDVGDGGKIIVWGDESTYFYGNIEAKGGLNGGNGGFAEVSGKQFLAYNGDVNLSGDVLGTLLLDPDDLDIVAGGANPAEFSDDQILFAENAGSISTIGADTISNQLTANANVILQANNTIDVDAAITSNGDGDLSLITGTGGVITINQAIAMNTGDLLLSSDEITLNASLSGLGDLTFTTADQSAAMELGGTSFGHSWALSSAEIDAIQNGFNSIKFGSSSYTGDIDVTGAVSFDDDVIFRQNANAEDVDVRLIADFTTTDGADLLVYGAEVHNSGASDSFIFVNSNLDIAGDLLLRGRTVKIMGTGAETINVGGDLTFNPVTAAHKAIFEKYASVAAGGDFWYKIQAREINNIVNLVIGGDLLGGSGGTHNGFQNITNMIVSGDVNLTSNGRLLFGATNTSIAGDLILKSTSSNLYGDMDADALGRNAINLFGDITVGGNTVLTASNASGAVANFGTLQSDGDLTINASGINLRSGSTLSGNADGSSTLTLREYGDNAAMELGGTSIGSTWQMTATEASTIQDGFSAITIGNSTQTGDIDISGAFSVDDALTLYTLGAVNIGDTLSAYESGNSLVIVANTVTNTAGAGALDPGAGRWLIYSTDPALNTLDGLAGDFKRYNKTYAGYTPDSVVETGNGLFYSIAPILTVSAQDSSRAYGDANAFTYSLAGFIDGDTQSTATTGEALLTSLATQSSTVGTYTIDAALGTLASALGYQFTGFTSGTLDIDKAALTVSLAESYSKEQGAINPDFVLNYSGFKLGETISILDVLPTVSTTAVTNSPDGQYEITIAGGLDDQYSFSYGSPVGMLSVVTPETPDTQDTALPSSWERVAYANDGLTVNVQPTVTFETTVEESTEVSSTNAESEPSHAQDDSDNNGHSGQPKRRKAQDKRKKEAVYVPGLNVLIEKSLARMLGMTGEQGHFFTVQ